MTKRAILIVATTVLVVVGLLPLVVMFLRSVTVDGHLSFVAYRDVLTSRAQWRLLRHSLVLSSWCAGLCTVVGVFLGIVLGKTDLPFRRVLAVLFTVPLLIPPYISAVSWSLILGREGLLAQRLSPSVAEVTSGWLFDLPGCVLVLSSTFLPVVMLLTMTFLKTINPRLEEAGRIVSGWPRVLKGITLPLVWPGIFLATLLVFLLTLGEFGVPTFLRYNVFPVEIFTQFSAFYDFRAATASALPLAAVTWLVLVVERIFLRKRTYEVKLASAGNGTLMIRLGHMRHVCLVIVSVLCFFIVVLPMATLVRQSMSLDAYTQAITQGGDSLLRSLGYAVVGASALSVLGFLLGYLIHTQALSSWQGIDSVTLFLFALPSTLLGIGLVLLWNRPSTNLIYATPTIIIFGYVAQYTALTSRITASTLTQIPPSMEEAAQVVGTGWLRRVALIVVPLARRGLLAGWLVGYIFCLRDTGISMMVYPPGRDTFPVRIFTLMANGSADFIAALCVIMVVATGVPLGCLLILFRFRRLAS
ncbi:MAG: iron ABC transporter permease [Planctomycetes bacterium]|nr:iron ABC transporter permease [Planctomycetota bacterium]